MPGNTYYYLLAVMVELVVVFKTYSMNATKVFRGRLMDNHVSL